MTRRLAFALLALALLGPGPAAVAEAQPRPVVVALMSSNAPYYTEHLAAFQNNFPGQVVRVSAASGEAAVIEQVAAARPALILAVGGQAARLAARLPSRPPVLFTMVYDPAAYGLIAGPSLCGLSLEVNPGQRLEALQALKPRAQGLRLGALHSPAADGRELLRVEAAARAAGYTLTVKEMAAPGGLEPALKELPPEIDALWLLAEPEVVPDEDSLRLILRQALDRKVMVAGISEAHVRAGALFAVSADTRAEGGRAAGLAVEIIGGRSPETVGILPPAHVVWSVNTKVAAELGLDLAPVPTLKRFQKVYP
jgi:putative tryptophan/tyrosine transport system substrate-binding protein